MRILETLIEKRNPRVKAGRKRTKWKLKGNRRRIGISSVENGVVIWFEEDEVFWNQFTPELKVIDALRNIVNQSKKDAYGKKDVLVTQRFSWVCVESKCEI